jgi:hypothetical protein
MKRLNALPVLCGIALLSGACAVPLGEDYVITRDGASGPYITGYNLENYVPIPNSKGNEPPVTVVNREDLEMRVVWKDTHGAEIVPPPPAFQGDTVYQAEIRVTAKAGYAFYPATPFAYDEGRISTQNDDLGSPARIIRVTYNNSDDADITFITDYILQSYVPIPLAGEEPVRSVTRGGVAVTAAWEAEKPEGFKPIPDSGYTFESGGVYRARIRLRVENLETNRFAEGKYFAYPAGTVAVQPDDDGDPEDRNLTPVTYKPARSPAAINDLNLTPYIPKPISGALGVGSFAGPQYAGTAAWERTADQAPQRGPFQAGVEYTAVLSLTPALGYSLNGAGPFVHGAGTVTNEAGAVRINFSAAAEAGAAAVVYDTVLTGRILRPTEGVTPARGITGNQYTGTVTWTPPHSTFQADTAYTAVLDLRAAPGYTFAGIGRDVFRHGDGAVTNPPGSGRVTIAFPPAASSAHPVTRFGPAEQDDSALWLIKEKRDYIYPLVIDLPGSPEELSSGVTLVAGDNSPGELVINGNNRVMKLTAGAVLTVGGGVSLTLRNITLEGVVNNTTPLLKVGPGGKLILEDGVKLINNKTAAGAGGVWVNNGALILNSGAEIRGMEARQGGGVVVDAFGNFIMNGGTIGGNRVSGEKAGGGVLVASGSFDMNGGTIEGNSAAAGSGGGGVCVLQRGTFNLNLGTIKENTAEGSDSGGGVCVISDLYGTNTVNFVMNGAGARIEGNTAQEVRSGGGVYCYGENYTGNFSLNRGTITNNRAQAEHSGGGVFVKYGKLNGATIRANYAAAGSSGGGVYIVDGTLSVYDGSIAENNAGGLNSGGGVYVAGGLSTYGGEITGNIAQEARSGGGIYAVSGVSVRGGEITDNIAKGAHSGGGVYIAGGEFWEPAAYGILVIEGNTARGADSGGGAYVAGGVFNPRGTIRGNLTPGRGYNCGVYVESTAQKAFTMEFDAKMADDNIVFLADGATIYVSSLRNVSSGDIIATIIHENPTSGITPLLRAYNNAGYTANFDKFEYGIGPGYIDPTPIQGTGGDTDCYALYKE